jgi:hypothetical protein
MIAQRLRQLGLAVREGPEVQADQELGGDLALFNPVTRAPLTRVTWAVRGGALVSVAPPALAQVAEVPLDALQSAEALAERLRAGFLRAESELQRRGAELQALGLRVQVDPSSLELRAELSAPGVRYTVVADRRGVLRLASAVREGGGPLALPAETSFELAEFRDGPALGAYLAAMAGEVAGGAAAAGPLRYGDLVRAFGEGTLVPPSSPLELLVELEVAGQRYRFAAARVAGRTFRGLLASGRGKVWAERFELDAFPGVPALVAQVLGVPPSAVRVLAAQEG